MTNTDAYELDLVTPNLAVGYQKEFAEGISTPRIFHCGQKRGLKVTADFQLPTHS